MIIRARNGGNAPELYWFANGSCYLYAQRKLYVVPEEWFAPVYLARPVNDAQTAWNVRRML